MKRKEKAAVDEFVALVGGKTWEPVRHKCMGKWSGMTDYGFVIGEEWKLYQFGCEDRNGRGDCTFLCDRS